jgi:serine/threonine protein kinase
MLKPWQRKKVGTEASTPKVSIVSFERKGAVATYDVTIGSFSVSVRVLNIAADELRAYKGSVIGTGNFGEVLLESGVEGNFVTKRIAFKNMAQVCRKAAHGVDWYVRANYSEIENVLMEYAIAKVCGIFGVGVPLFTPYGFDILCFKDHLEFSMELCYSRTIPKGNEEVAKRLRYCLRVMHLLGMVHKDIKHANILYCASVDDYVFCDFGLSHAVAESLGFTSHTHREGTNKFMSPEMRSIKERDSAYIDLYYNDMYGLQITLTTSVDKDNSK